LKKPGGTFKRNHRIHGGDIFIGEEEGGANTLSKRRLMSKMCFAHPGDNWKNGRPSKKNPEKGPGRSGGRTTKGETQKRKPIS